MRHFYAYTDLSITELLSTREALGNDLRKMMRIQGGESFSVDMFNEQGLLITHFEY